MMTLLDRLRDLCDKHSDTLGNPFIREAIATISAAKSELATIENETIERCATCRSVVPILPGEIPQEMFDSLQGDKDACAEAFRIVVRQTLDEYEAAILSLKKEG